MKVYAVIDTNVLVSAFLTRHPDSATVKVLNAISDGFLIPLYNQEILKEIPHNAHGNYWLNFNRLLPADTRVCF
jgi:predicted nucleic acid-binding protein